ncbi:hypothetical protein B0T20DRAFT_392825 [Sordaria brevicollis]|uniref:Ecp2 effector protein domain-containing protein n=1 Tax=Sordaria brevicollis TaxID=83679 RepID=A0AAE0UCG5_SORBR|nr:hypothetical protein B0T20DRAFT_392825 [Sordaria brevicollis]
MLLSGIIPLAFLSLLPVIDAGVLPTTLDARAPPRVYLCPSTRATNDQWGVWRGVNDNISWLEGVKGEPVNRPHSCGRIACSHDTAVYWCNNNWFEYGLPSYKVIADAVRNIRDNPRCQRTGAVDKDGPLLITGVRGELEFNSGWSAVVRSEKC